MKYRVWDLDQDYPILRKWCKERAFDNEIPKEMLPPQGIIVEDEEPIGGGSMSFGSSLSEARSLHHFLRIG
jgi:hypothetical protein